MTAKPLAIDFRRCPDCGGYGVRDSGANCRTCGGSRGCIGSGEIMVERGSGRVVTIAEFNRHHGIGQ